MGTNAPVDHHRELARRVATELSDRDDVRSVLIAGSVGRGEHTANSDVDLLVVVTADSVLTTSQRTVREGLLVEYIARTPDRFRERFDRPSTSWLYAFLEAEIVYDLGPAAQLVANAYDVLATFQTSAEDRAMLAALLWYHQARLDRAAASGDPRQQAFCSSLLVELVIHALYAIHHVPRAPGTRQLAQLHRVALTPNEAHLLDRMLVADVPSRFKATCHLVAHVRAALGPPELEKPYAQPV